MLPIATWLLPALHIWLHAAVPALSMLLFSLGDTLRLAVPAQLYPTDIRYPFLGAEPHAVAIPSARSWPGLPAAAFRTLTAQQKLTCCLHAGQGTCFPAVKRGDVYDVRCLGPEEFLKPGQVQPCRGLCLHRQIFCAVLFVGSTSKVTYV